MNRIASVFIATSLDGFIAREDGGIDWLNAANESLPEGEDCGFFAFLDSIDALVMGRKTFEQVLTFGEWPYGDKPVIVLSRKRLEIPETLSKTVSWSSEDPLTLTERLAANGAKRLYVDGGATIQGFLAQGLVKDITITVIPVALGRGKPLFGELKHDIALRHVSTKAYEFGFVQSCYEIVD